MPIAYSLISTQKKWKPSTSPITKWSYRTFPNNFIYNTAGKYQKVRKQSKREAEKCRICDQDEKQSLINRQLKEHQNLQRQIQGTINKHKSEIQNLRQDISLYMEMGGKSQKLIQENMNQIQKQQNKVLEKDKDKGFEPEM